MIYVVTATINVINIVLCTENFTIHKTITYQASKVKYILVALN